MTDETLQMLESFFYQQRKGNLIHLTLHHPADDSWGCELYKERSGRQRHFKGQGTSLETALRSCLQEVEKIYNLSIQPGLWHRLFHAGGLAQRLASWNDLEERLKVPSQFSLYYYYKESRGSRWQGRLDRAFNSRGSSAAAAIRRLLAQAEALPAAAHPA
ncbi:MAG TPA: hypothetical protein P5555_03955 [Candidatus Paceibacterota bacterium]|nr:hypothetical protein [Verrucomicrobiota bacterium]HOX01587.1 hypothetical protein [Verrucomicrobiota bacterium]HRZ44325.1 hypothetical protein [Candidatus Paceibacterota bacterium]HRZ92321.1 hypothetical protein [Candidatus Paceibacterota bacterium]